MALGRRIFGEYELQGVRRHHGIVREHRRVRALSRASWGVWAMRRQAVRWRLVWRSDRMAQRMAHVITPLTMHAISSEPRGWGSPARRGVSFTFDLGDM